MSKQTDFNHSHCFGGIHDYLSSFISLITIFRTGNIWFVINHAITLLYFRSDILSAFCKYSNKIFFFYWITMDTGYLASNIWFFIWPQIHLSHGWLCERGNFSTRVDTWKYFFHISFQVSNSSSVCQWYLHGQAEQFFDVRNAAHLLHIINTITGIGSKMYVTKLRSRIVGTNNNVK